MVLSSRLLLRGSDNTSISVNGSRSRLLVTKTSTASGQKPSRVFSPAIPGRKQGRLIFYRWAGQSPAHGGTSRSTQATSQLHLCGGWGELFDVRTSRKMASVYHQAHEVFRSTNNSYKALLIMRRVLSIFLTERTTFSERTMYFSTKSRAKSLLFV